MVSLRCWYQYLLGLTVGAVTSVVMFAAAADTEPAETRMLAEIAEDFRLTAHLTGRAKMRESVAKAMREVPRHAFVAPEKREQAYINRPLLIGHGQTISQPFIVALMTDLLDLRGDEQVLEIGTGSGYQAAILAEIAQHVTTVEIIAELASTAAERLQRLGYHNVDVHVGDGNYGWPAAAPFDRIIVTAGGRLPPRLLAQLKPGGRMVIPVNQSHSDQQLLLIEKHADGKISQQAILPVRFVPITGDN